ncbi:DNA helicase RecQ [Clostridium chauvoei]|uniref:DNA helicase RecQ n=2 Tax=Clostridium chauvoei TaxID=46867 RepID=S6ES52_9CLOT|nr:DNA helicase RecQ [Clostridium chauvoei]ATD55331.1 ATP-dependent DNA helicase RecQ [Clostridium chauvoei]ATD56994.1 ATP-dependent DNA helicase RecQ [Clostridium chauvoei]MBX7280843.1 DNA helicase RecQ [Clostridium chauvoei]MBX7283326.1 DNA helicase RecQ [Clostridium chauvoei]MBX7285800.1 DNA helicase RecQ [Clostridium chauvoei]
MTNKALEILEKVYGYKSFRKGQEDIINNILNRKDVLAIMPTGGGKSICYQIPSLILDGITIVISPLISLMKDQVDAIKEMGINGVYINSSLSTIEFNSIIDGIRSNKYKIIYVAPERLDSNEFITAITQNNISQVAIDEAHCVSQWGHDFRSSYKRIDNFINKLPKRPIVSAFTATATNEVKEDIIKLLGLKEPKVFITGFDRENLTINIIKSGNKKDYLINYIENNKDQSGIIYAATRREVDKIYDELKNRGYEVGKYHAGLSDEVRKEYQDNFIHDNLNIIVATNAFGMGIDKPNIRYVVHYNMPKNIEGYYQEIGRAGRDGEKSECILLFAPGDVQVQKYLIEMSIENQERKNNQYEKLQQMVDLVYSNGCLRNYILNYFGDRKEEPCNNCSNCLYKGEVIDKTIDAQKVLSCVYRMKRSFGSTMVVDVLRGSKNKKVSQFGFDNISTYGIMKDYSNEDLKTFINTLVAQGYLDLVQGTYPTLKLNNLSMKVLKSEKEVKLKEFKVERKLKDTNKLFEILKVLRLNISRKENLPPYIIFGDGTLREMSIKYPIQKEDMLKISGVGEGKYNKYGIYFREEIEKYVKENNIDIDKNNNVESDLSDFPFEVVTDKGLLEELLNLRDKFAKKEGVPRQKILAKNSLKEISGRYPMNIEELKDIGGVGSKKIELYGDEIIEKVKTYVSEKNIQVHWTEKKRRKLIIDGETRGNDEIALDSLKEGKKLEDISEEIEISISTILGYVADYIKETGDSNFSLDLKKYYNAEDRDNILKACNKNGYDKISIIKKQLSDTIKYEAIRAVILEEYFKVS